MKKRRRNGGMRRRRQEVEIEEIYKETFIRFCKLTSYHFDFCGF